MGGLRTAVQLPEEEEDDCGEDDAGDAGNEVVPVGEVEFVEDTEVELILSFGAECGEVAAVSSRSSASSRAEGLRCSPLCERIPEELELVFVGVRPLRKPLGDDDCGGVDEELTGERGVPPVGIGIGAEEPAADLVGCGEEVGVPVPLCDSDNSLLSDGVGCEGVLLIGRP